jgi:hypothetical protein
MSRPTELGETSELGDIETKPILLTLPPAFIKQFPKRYKAEFYELDITTLRLQMVDPKTPPGDRRYAIVRHKGSAWVNVPRRWLRDQQVEPGDSLETSAGDTANELKIRVVRRVP